VLLDGGTLGIAKFPKPDDTRDIPAGEILALAVARAAGLRSTDHRLVKVGTQSVAVVTRFDRQDGRRLPFLSAASLLGLDGEAGAWTMIADAIRQWGHDVPGDLRELFRRMVFSLLASNCDDHLRNHGFLMRTPGHWALAPAYDLNPVPEIDRVLDRHLPISEDAGTPSIAAALAAAGRFLLARADAREILAEVDEAVAGWRTIGRRLRIPAPILDAYRTAFEQPMGDEARSILRR